MKAAVFNRYGEPEVLHIEDIPKPKINSSEILIRVRATAATAGDARIRGARFPTGFGFLGRLAFGIVKPRNKVLGGCFSGVVEEVGSSVTDFEIGDEVCGMTGIAMGCYAEYVKVVAHKGVIKKPLSVSHEQAAGVLFGGTTALYFIRDKANVVTGETVAINGASGAVGTNAVQLAKHLGAKVTGVTSGGNTRLVRRLGAEYVIDHTKQGILESGKKFDVVFDTVGNLAPADSKVLLTEKGRLLLAAGSLAQLLQSRGKVISGTASEKKKDIHYVLALVEAGKLEVVVDSTFTLDEIAVAHQRVDSGSKVGNVVILLP